MAGSGGDADPKWPLSVSFNDDDPTKGYAYIWLGVEGLEVKKPLFGKATAKNADILEKQILNELVLLKIKVSPKSGKDIVYQYKKPLPESIVPEKCDIQFAKGSVILKLCKEEDQSWAQHAKHFIKQD